MLEYPMMKKPISKLPLCIRNHIAQYDQDIMWPNNVPISIHNELAGMLLHNISFLSTCRN